MRCRRAIRTLLVFVLLGAVATVLSSWAIHAVQFRRVRANANPLAAITPRVMWYHDEGLASRLGIDTGIESGEIGVETTGPYWTMFREAREDGAPVLLEAQGINADAAWRRHRLGNDRLSPLPSYPFPYMLFESRATRRGWCVLRSETDLSNEAFEPEHGIIEEVLILVQTGWPARAMELGSHYAQISERYPPDPSVHARYAYYKRVEEVQHPPRVAMPSGLELWSAPRPPAMTGRAQPIDYAVTDRFALPLLPLWPGFLINTLFYALLLFIAWRTPIFVRRAVRRRRGRCVGCGYSRDGLDPQAACPECGAGAPIRRARARPWAISRSADRPSGRARRRPG